MAIIRLNYKPNRTQRRRPSRAHAPGRGRRPGRAHPQGLRTQYAARAVWYCTYGRAATTLDRELAVQAQRGLWYGTDGRVCPYTDVAQWTHENAGTHKYLFQIILSTGPEPQIPMRPADWVTVLQADARFENYRFIEHNDTSHTHVHVIAWGDKVLSRGEHAHWHDALQMQLAAVERERVRELTLAREQTREQAHALSPEIEPTRTRTREQDLSL